MQISGRHFISPLAAVLTLTIGLAVAAAINTNFSLFSSSAVVPNKVPVVVRPAENADPPVRQKVEMSCYDLSILPIWHELKNDSSFKERLQFASGLVDCSEMLQVTKTDLNRDGNDEFLVRGKGTAQCGGIGNCGYWIFELKNGVVRKLLEATHQADQYEFGVDEVQKSRAHGYPDILLTDRNGQFVLFFRSYRFDGSQYTESRCMSEVPKSLRDGAGSWEVITCNEFYLRWDSMRRSLYEAGQ
ncbi:MAG: hypothetical protein DMF63_09645 [Acidobacteria bacterium]|nr:MAG: hypothetical protein DMF63_09645 [Acidobacteriota bacterium]